MIFSASLPDFEIRPATIDEVPLILSFIKKLAQYERLAHEVVATEESLRETLFNSRKTAEVAIGYFQNTPIGLVLFFHNYSTFLSRPGLYIEDLFIDESYRRKGFGAALLRYVARLAIERNCGRVEWSVLDWNKPAVDFYTRLGAVPLSDWTVFRVTGQNLVNLAAE
jgi:GNAT superfamily N-acetyltransferase